ALAPPWYEGAAVGLTAGAFALGFFWAGAALPGWPLGGRRESPSTGSYRRRAPGSGLVSRAPVVLAVAGAAAAWGLGRAQWPPAGPAPILALFPYDGRPDPSRAPDRVLLRLNDYERLRSLADEARAGEAPSLAAKAALHRVAWRDGGAVAV